MTLMKNKIRAVSLTLMLTYASGCDSDGGADDDPKEPGNGASDNDTDSASDSEDQGDTGEVQLPEGTPIDELGSADLEVDLSPVPSALLNLPSLEGVDPEVAMAFESQTLPDPDETLHGLDKTEALLTGALSQEDLTSALLASGMARHATPEPEDRMSEVLDSLLHEGRSPSILLTADALFNTFHIFFDNMLLGVENRVLQHRVDEMVRASKIEAARRYNALPDGDTKQAALDVVAYLQVAESLLDPESEVVAEVRETVLDELDKIYDHSSLSPSPIFDRPSISEGLCQTCDPCKVGECVLGDGDDAVPCPERHCEDYTQYAPRGHYTSSEAMERYFRAVMWLGRAAFFNRSEASTRAAVVLIDSLKSADAIVDGETVPAMDVWRQIFRVVGTFVGGIDDLSIPEIDGAVTSVAGDALSLADLDDDALVRAIQSAVDDLRDPAILSGIMSARAEMESSTEGLRLLGQAFLPDSYALSRLVFRHVGASAEAEHFAEAAEEAGFPPNTDPKSLTEEQNRQICNAAFMSGFFDVCRGMPSGLDVASVLGHPRARALAEELWGSYAGYSDSTETIAEELASYDLDRWGLSVAWTWLFALEGLFREVDAGAPAFMRQEAWQDKTLETGLSSWTEMRHDTILYAKQSYTDYSDGDVDIDADLDFDYVEPQPRAYSRLAAAVTRLKSLGGDEGLFAGDAENLLAFLDRLEEELGRATEISIKELTGEALTGADTNWIRFIGGHLQYLETGILRGMGVMSAEEEADPARLKSTVVADVHTFPAKGVVLQVGSGYLDYVTVLHQLPTGEWGVATGPAFSYHEFEHPMSDRLTDEAWRNMLSEDLEGKRPDWLD